MFEPSSSAKEPAWESSGSPTWTSELLTSNCPPPTTPRCSACSWPAAAGGEDTVYLKCWDEEDHHSVRLRYDPRTGLDLFTFRVEREDDLAELENAVPKYGCQVQRISKGEAVGQGESIRFGIPSGQIMELVWDLEKTGNLLGKLNPAPVPPPDLPGIAPPRLDHMLINAEEVGEAAHFFQQVLGFRMTEQVLDANGHQLGRLAGTQPLPARHRHRQRAERRAAPLRLLARRLGPGPQGRRHPRLSTACRSTRARPGTG